MTETVFQLPGLGYAMIAIGIGFIPAFVRIARAQVLTIRSLDYVEAAKATGTGNTMILLRHVLPNSLPPLLVQTTLAIGYAIIAEATLSFLGLGAEPGEPSWGSMLFQAKRSTLRPTTSEKVLKRWQRELAGPLWPERRHSCTLPLRKATLRARCSLWRCWK